MAGSSLRQHVVFKGLAELMRKKTNIVLRDAFYGPQLRIKLCRLLLTGALSLDLRYRLALTALTMEFPLNVTK